MKTPSISIWGYFGHSNTGDEAILTVMLSELRRHDLGDNLTLFAGDTEKVDPAYGVNVVSAILSTRFSQHWIRILGRNRASYYRTLKAFKDTEVVIVGGGGLFFDLQEHNTFLLNLLDLIDKALSEKNVSL